MYVPHIKIKSYIASTKRAIKHDDNIDVELSGVHQKTLVSVSILVQASPRVLEQHPLESLS
jgi:hypothetical protein